MSFEASVSLLDHFHPPLSAHRHWEGFHSKWAGTIVDRLNELLPPRYFAEPNVHRGPQIEIDVATFEDSPLAVQNEPQSTMVWSPPQPTHSISLETDADDVFEVRIVNDEAGPQLVAAIELVSPGNKDRAEKRAAFTTKCAAYVQQGISVIVVDVVTSREAALHQQLLATIQPMQNCEAGADNLFAAAYRPHRDDQQTKLEIWFEPLAIGGDLPTLPLWISTRGAVPVELGQSYFAACRSLRIDA